ncbi:hypothetical protein EBR25_12690, partial [bacterium]|nr:hypothetical protein [bacterium]
PDDEDNRPDPRYVQQALRDDNGDPTQAGANRLECQLPTTTFDSIPECFQRTLWDYVYHFVSEDPDLSVPSSVERNSRKWTWSDEKSLYFGNIIYTEFKNSQQDLLAASNSSPQLANAIKRREQELPPSTRWVNFWGPNAPTNFPLGGHWTPLKGVELLRAIFLQDYYGALYTLSFKMCEHSASSAKRYNLLQPEVPIMGGSYRCRMANWFCFGPRARCWFYDWM